jgi:hypothetical protein
MLGAMTWNVLNEACRDGHIWRETIPVTLIAGDPNYTIAPVGTEVIHLFGLSHATIDFNATAAVFEFGALTLTPSPTVADVAAGDLYAVAALAPALDAPNATSAEIEALVPTDMWSENHNLFSWGILAKMMSQPAKPYSNPQLAAFYHRRFTGELAEQKRKVATGGVPGAQTWRFNKWAPRARR